MSEGIVYQNKDILFKILSQTYKEKSFAAYGIDLPKIRKLLPTDLPKIRKLLPTDLPKIAATKKALTTCFCWKTALMRL